MEEEIIEKLYNQDKQAHEYIYKKYSAKMFRICYRYVGNEFDAAEILNDGFCKIFKHINKFKNGELKELIAWMSKIMVNESLQFIRKNKKIRFVDEIEAITECSPVNDIQVDAEIYYELIRQLNDAYRMVFNLFVIEGYTHKEIAEMLNIPENTSRSHLLRARLELQEKIQNIFPL